MSEEATHETREKHLTKLFDRFWNRWKAQYLTQLRDHNLPSKKSGAEIQPGDVVLIQKDKVKLLIFKLVHSNNQKSYSWKRRRREELYRDCMYPIKVKDQDKEQGTFLSNLFNKRTKICNDVKITRDVTHVYCYC